MKRFNLEEYLKNPTRKIVTRDGRNVKILCTNYYLGNQCVIAEIEDIDRSFSFNQYGQQYGNTEDSPLNLFFAPEKHEGWINVFDSRDGSKYLGDSRVFKAKEDAEEAGKNWSHYITSVKIEWEE